MSYDYSNAGPWGVTVNDQLKTTSQLNTSFSQRAWEDAKQDGCLPQPCLSLPQWPPPAGQGFVYPTQQKKPIEILDLGTSGFHDQQVPFVEPQQRVAKVVVSVPEEPLSARIAQRIASQMLDMPLPEPTKQVTVELADPTETPTCHAWNQKPLTASIEPSSTATPSPTPAPSPSPYEDDKCLLNNTQFSVPGIPSCVWKTWEGVAYDMEHWGTLPPSDTWSKLGYVLGRNDRPFYLVVSVTMLLVVIMLLRVVFGTKKSRSLSRPQMTYCPACTK